MDKKMRLSFLFFFIIFICASFSVVAANDAKVIYDIVERDEAVDVTIKIKGEVTKLTAFTFYTGYDNTKLEYIEESFKNGELLNEWIVPYVKNVDVSPAYVYFTATPGLNEQAYYSVEKDEEKVVASFSFVKNKNVFINEDSILPVEVMLGPSKMKSVINTLGNGDIRFDTMPERFVTVFTPYMEGENTVPVENLILVDELGYAVSENQYILRDDSLQLYAEILPTYAADKALIWSAEGVVDVDEQGLVTAKEVGEGTVTVTSKDGSKRDTIKIVVQDKEVAAEAIVINNGKKDLSVNELYQFTAEIKPDDTTNQQVVWSVSNTNATVNPKTGLLKALKVGDTIVKATSVRDSELVAEYNITIHEAAPIGIEAAAISVLVPEKLYVNTNSWSVNSYKIGFNVFNANAMPVLKEDSLGTGWNEFYTVEYSDNFADKGAKGITRKEDVITISPEAQDIQGLQVEAKLKNKVDGQVILTALSNMFDVKGKIQVTDIIIEGAEIIESSGDSSYKTDFAIKSPDKSLSLKTITNGTVYYSYQINNGQIIKSGVEISIDSSMINQGDDITIFIYSDNRPGAAGYSYNAFVDQVTVHISK